MKTVAVISFTNLDTDPRVNRQIRFLCNHYHVIAFGMRSPGIDGVRFVPLTFPRLPFLPRKRWKMMRRILRLTRNFEKYYWNLPDPRQTTEILRQYRFDLILANDIDSLPAALEGAQGAKVVFDAHEYAPLEFEDQLSFRLFYQKYNEYLCNTYIPKTDAMLTVGPRIAEQYEEDTGVKPVVITNAPEYENLEPTLLKEGKPIRLVHHGGAIKSRKIEKMIRMMDSLDGFPVQVINNMMGGTSTTTLNKVEQKDLPKTLFQVPEDYRLVQAPRPAPGPPSMPPGPAPR